MSMNGNVYVQQNQALTHKHVGPRIVGQREFVVEYAHYIDSLRALFEFLEQSLTHGCEPAGCLSSPEGQVT